MLLEPETYGFANTTIKKDEKKPGFACKISPICRLRSKTFNLKRDTRMKKKWIILPLLAAVQAVSAQQERSIAIDETEWETKEVEFPKHEIDIGIGLGDRHGTFDSDNHLMFGKNYYWQLSPMEKYNREKYSDQTSHFDTSYSLSYRYGWNKHLYTGIIAGYHPRECHYTLAATGERVKEKVRNSLIMMPSVRYYYFSRGKTRFYSELAAGISFDKCKNPDENEYRHRICGTVQATLIGASLWVDRYANLFCEASVGDLCVIRCGVTVKINNRFDHTAKKKSSSGKPGRHGINKRNGRPMRLF